MEVGKYLESTNNNFLEYLVNLQKLYFTASKNFKRKVTKQLKLVLILAIFLVGFFVVQHPLPIVQQNPVITISGQPGANNHVTSGNVPISNYRLNLISKTDVNNNLIADGLDTKIASLPGTSLIKIIVILKKSEPVPKSLLTQFTRFGGHTSNVWNSFGMFAGTMLVNAIKTFAKAMKSSTSPVGLIEENRHMVTYSIQNRLTNIEPYVRQHYGFLGDSNSSIAIFDTGIDASHPMLANYSATPNFTNSSIKVVGWKDATPDNYTTPVDFDGHGTHVAAIAAGNPYNDTFANGYINTTYTANFNYTTSVSGTLGSFSYLNITTPGTVSFTFFWRRTGGTNNTKGVEISLYSPNCSPSTCYSLASNSTNIPISANSGEYILNYTVGITGLYALIMEFNYADANSSLDMVSYGSYPYKGTLSSLGSYFSGAAPDTKLVGIKVFDKSGVGLASYLVNGINWAIQNKKIYHIDEASMSLGFPCSPTGCTSADKVVSVEIAVNDLVNAGIVTFVAAGNDGSLNNDQIGTPGDVNSVITVGATDNFHIWAHYSSYGPYTDLNNFTNSKPDILAPGGAIIEGGILSADTNNNDAIGLMDGVIPDFQKNDLTSMSGTSMATPLAAGIGSLIIQAMGGYSNWNYSIANVYKIKQIISLSAGLGNGKDSQVGWGEINAKAAIDLVHPYQDYIVGNTLQSSNRTLIRKVHLSTGYDYNFSAISMSNFYVHPNLYSTNYNEYGNPIIYGRSGSSSIDYAPVKNGTFLITTNQYGNNTFGLYSLGLSNATLGIHTSGDKDSFSWNVIGNGYIKFTLYINNRWAASSFETIHSSGKILYLFNPVYEGLTFIQIKITGNNVQLTENNQINVIYPSSSSTSMLTSSTHTAGGFEIIAISSLIVLVPVKRKLDSRKKKN